MQNYNNNPNNPHNAIEVPIPRRRTPFWRMLAFIIVLFGLILAAMAAVKSPYVFEKYGNNIKLAFIALFLFEPVIGIIYPFVETARLKRVCTERAGGTLVGYASEYVRDYNDETQSDRSYYKYAPKYEIYINGHFEIRTLNDFTRSKSSPRTIALLANPNGYEIIPTAGKMSYSNKQSVKSGITLLIIFALILAALAFFLPGLGLNF